MPRPQRLSGFADLNERILAAAKSAISLTAIDAEALAIQEAPVRKLFKGQRRSTRELTYREFRAEASTRRRLGLPTTIRQAGGRISTEMERPGSFGGAGAASRPTNPYLRARSHRVAQPPELTREVNVGTRALVNPHPILTGRGRYEVAHGAKRGDVRVGGAIPRTQVGGRLKHSIFISRLETEGRKIVQRIHSPVYYSKYVEFGTRHAAAQPYMRPALAKVRESYRNEMVKSIRSGIRRRAATVEIPAGAEVAPAQAAELVSPSFGQAHPVLGGE